ncbi:hypothetical protein HJB89_13460 [Rhizobium sp. NZLR8]|uniref:hypothetical protein n=1 Tax=Rhizobium sp. NZLR8 TaxID=2731104 RepID=UPI001C82D88D|nr:hypothetical protein [Rhizobium sp. NZLR8]MBX5158124.1 hypothetical protein [Rhizobium sp. NZLR8]
MAAYPHFEFCGSVSAGFVENGEQLDLSRTGPQFIHKHREIVRPQGSEIIFRFSFSPDFWPNDKILPMFFARARQMASAVDGF